MDKNGDKSGKVAEPASTVLPGPSKVVEASSLDEAYNPFPPSKFLKERNKYVTKYLKAMQEKEKKGKGKRPQDPRKGSLETSEKWFPPSKIPPGMLDCDYSENNVVANDPDTSDGSDYCERFLGKPTVKQLVEGEEKRGSSMELSGTVAFSHSMFNQARKAKWRIFELKRRERILRGEVVGLLPKELYDHEAQFQRSFGAVDKSHKSYTNLLQRFKAGRLEMMAAISDAEKSLSKDMREKNFSSDETNKMAEEVAMMISILKKNLAELPEANMDMNPYTSPQCTDFFVLPRKNHPISTYVVRPTELSQLAEFSLEEKMNLFFREGYNAAIYDVGYKHYDNVAGDFDRIKYFNGSTRAIQKNPNLQIDIGESVRIFNDWKGHLSRMAQMMKDYLQGIEAKMFIWEFRKKEKLFDSERLFGYFHDVEGLRYVSEVFFIQKLGKGNNQREILFPAFLEGSIATPQEMLVRTWNKLIYLLSEEGMTEVDGVKSRYEDFFGERMYFLDWGFMTMEDFIKYSRTILPEQLKEVRIKEETVEKVPPNRGVSAKTVKFRVSFLYVENEYEEQVTKEQAEEETGSFTSTHSEYEYPVFVLDEPLIPWTMEEETPKEEDAKEIDEPKKEDAKEIDEPKKEDAKEIDEPKKEDEPKKQDDPKEEDEPKEDFDIIDITKYVDEEMRACLRLCLDWKKNSGGRFKAE